MDKTFHITFFPNSSKVTLNGVNIVAGNITEALNNFNEYLTKGGKNPNEVEILYIMDMTAYNDFYCIEKS